MSKQAAFCTSCKEQFIEIDPVPFSLRILALNRKDYKICVHSWNRYLFLPLPVFKNFSKTDGKGMRGNIKSLPNSRKGKQTRRQQKCYLCSSVFIKRRNLLTKGNTIQCSCSNPRLPAGFGSPIYYIHIRKCKPCVLIVKLSPYIHVIKWWKWVKISF